jgi:hypothetical protein
MNSSLTSSPNPGFIDTGFENLTTQSNFKSDNTPQPPQSIDATFVNEDGEVITISIDEVTLE